MNRKRAAGLALAFALLILLALTVAREVTRPAPLNVRGPLPPVELGVLPPGTPTPANWRAGLVIVRDSANYTAATPRPGQVGTHIEVRPTTIGATPNWGPVETAVAKAAGRGLKSWISVNIFDDLPYGTPDVTYGLPGWPTVVYDDGCGNQERAPDYRTLATPYAPFVQALTDRFDGNADVAGYVFGPGVAEEAINAYGYAPNCATKRERLEQVVSCEAYMAWVKTGARIWAENTDKPVTLAAGAGACVSEYANSLTKTNQQIFGYLYPATPVPGAAPKAGVTPTPIYGIQYRSNGLRLDGGDEWDWNSGWGKLQAGARLAEIAGAAYEFGTLGRSRPSGCSDGFPCAIPTAERIGYTSDAAWKAMAAGATNLFWQCNATGGCWPDWLSPDARYAMTRTMGLDWTNSPAAWVRFADAVIPRTSANVYRSDMPGPWGLLATARGVNGIQPVRYCAPGVYATAVAAGGAVNPTPQVCERELAAPVAPESRYAFRYEPLTTVGVDVDDRWVGRTGNFTAWVIYLDAGTDTFTVAWKNESTEATRTITKTNSNTWKKEAWSLAATMNDSYGEHDLEIRTLGGAETLYLVFLENTGTLAAPTPTRTGTPRPTPAIPPGSTATPAPAAVASAAEIGRPESVTLYAGAPNATHAGAQHEYLTWDGGPTSTVLLRWPELSLPANSWVVSATLTFRVSAPTYATARLREVARRAEPSAATWHYSGAEPWAAGGALGAADTRSDTALAFSVTSNWQSYTVRVDNAIRRWLEQGEPNSGWLFELTSGGSGDNLDPLGGATGPVQAELAGAGHPLVDYRPQLTVWLAWSTATPTATPTRTQTPTVISTGTPLPTPTGTPTPTATPPSGLWLSEVCLNPDTDLNLDGKADTLDRAVELLNWQGGEQTLDGWRLTVNATCASTDPQNTFELPRLSTVRAYGAKVIYGRDLRNLVGESFGWPASGMIRLCDPSGRERDAFAVPETAAGVCLARNGATWIKTSGASLGQ